MGYQLRIEDSESIFFLTNRSIESRLWFINNKELELKILSFLARYQDMYGVELYSFVLMGNHYHLIARFPRCNKSAFMRDFNGMVSKLVSQHVPSFRQGKLWARRYSEQVLPRNEDVEHWFFYAALNPTLSGLAKDLKSYQGYNSFSDAVSGRSRVYEVFEKSAYEQAKWLSSSVKKADYIKRYTLSFTRLPGYEQLLAKEYKKLFFNTFGEKVSEAIRERLESGKGFTPIEVLQAQKPGAYPRSTKKSSRYSFRPLVLTLCTKTKEAFLKTYFNTLDAFRQASTELREGALNVTFPQGTYKPYILVT